MIEVRDGEWRRILEQEIAAAERFFEKKAKSQIEAVETKVMAELKRA
jgi:hypothetical protein